MALNICGICDSQDSHQGRANKGTLNTDSGISTAQILVSDFPLGEKQTAGLLKKSVFCIFCKVFQSDFFFPLLLLRKPNVLSLLALSCSSPCCGGEATCGPAAVGRSGTWTGRGSRAVRTAPQTPAVLRVSTGVLGGRAGEGCTADWCRGQMALPWCAEMGDASPAQRALLCGAVLVQNDGSVMIYQLLLGCPPEHQRCTGLCSQLRGRKVKDEPSSWTAANLKGSSLKALV